MIGRLRVDVTARLQGFELSAAFETDAASLGLFGASGAGKTTLLESIAGLRRDVRGRIEVGDVAWLDSDRRIDRPPEARGAGYVPQDALLFPHWNVLGNVLAGSGRSRRGETARIDPEHVLEVLDLAPLRVRDVAALSGGERQRVALARALCSAPSLLLLDEPLASIDPILRGRILHYLLAVRDEFRIPTIYVSHDAGEISALCGEVIVLRAGKIAARGAPARVFTEERSASGIEGSGYENVLEATLVAAGEGRAVAALASGPRLTLGSAAGASPGAHVLVGIAASDLLLAIAETPGLSARNVVPGRILSLRETDGGVLVSVSIGEADPPIVVMVTEAARGALSLREGLELRLVAKAQACRLIAVR